MATKKSPNRQIIKSAVASRLLLLTLITLWRSFLTPYDTSASINPNCLSSSQHNSPQLIAPSIRFPRIGSLIEDSIVWDSVYFVRIAECGYEYEQSYAFLPLLPICISLLSKSVFAPLVPLIGYRAVLGLSGYVLNNVAFVCAAAYFHRLSLIILKDSEAAVRASILFCFNPASIFYSSIYSESLYALLSIGGVCHLMSGSNNLATLLLALSGSARSNGVLNAGYICFQMMHHAYDALFLKRLTYLTVQILILGALRCIFISSPFIAFQVYGYYNICVLRSHDEIAPWCRSRLPLLYNYIQSHYWGVGFLNYFQVKQLPNFLLAFPILSLALCSIIYYVKLRPDVFFSLGFQASNVDKRSYPRLFNVEAEPRSTSVDVSDREFSKISQEENNLRRRGKTIKQEDSVMTPLDYSSVKEGYLSVIILPFVLHLGFMSATAFFVMHVQVATRFLSASPSLYWFASYLTVYFRAGKRWGYLIWGYSTAYILLGSLLFSNFYPFT